jgi:predicted PurR-regulated permease PerM
MHRPYPTASHAPRAPADAAPPAGREEFTRRLRLTLGATALLVLALLAAWRVADVLLVVFAGILFALFLRGLGDLLAARTRLGPTAALTVVVIALAGLLGAAGWWLAGDIAEQVEQLARDIPRAIGALRERLERYEWGRLVLTSLPVIDAEMAQRVLAQAPGVLSRTLGTTLGFLTNLVIVTVVGLYLAYEPRLYAGGLVRLLPPARRPRGEAVLHALRVTLQWWLIGKVIVMALVGLMTGIGLWAIGLPLALTLGLLAGLLDFIPYVGPVLGFAPAVLLALTQDTTIVLYVAALYLVVQSLESYVLTPLVQRQAVALAPALTISAQIVLTVLFGGLGLVLATPLTAAGLVLVKMLYLEDVLGEDVEIAAVGRP